MSEEILYSVRGPKSWHDMTSREVAEALKETDVVLVPCGAIENHGSHLPLMTDTYAVEELVRRTVLILEQEGKKAIFGPTIPFGPIANVKFPGSINISPTTMVVLIKEVCYSLYSYGAKNIALIKGHDFTYGALMVAARELVNETDDDLKVIVVNWLPVLIPMLKDIYQDRIPDGKRDGHAGAGETSRMLWQYPNLVDKDQYKDYAQEDVVSKIPFGQPMIVGGGIYAPQKTTNEDPNFEGFAGYPSVATAEIGDRIYEEISKWLAEIVKEYCYGPIDKVYGY